MNAHYFFLFLITLIFLDKIENNKKGGKQYEPGVRKRRDYIGGSARQKIIDIAEDDEECFQVPLINSLFRFCVFQKKVMKY